MGFHVLVTAVAALAMTWASQLQLPQLLMVATPSSLGIPVLTLLTTSARMAMTGRQSFATAPLPAVLCSLGRFSTMIAVVRAHIAMVQLKLRLKSSSDQPFELLGCFF